MEPLEVVPEGKPQQETESSPTTANGKGNPPPKKTNARKRTKTGCLTCRRRRIKCDEGKPTCNNCIKSKRQCEGYNQRVIFKEPIGAFHPGGPFVPLVYHTEPPESFINLALPPQPKSSSSQGPLQVIAPKPGPIGYHHSSPLRYGPPYPAQQGPQPINGVGLEQVPHGQQPVPHNGVFIPQDMNSSLPQGGGRTQEDFLNSDHPASYSIYEQQTQGSPTSVCRPSSFSHTAAEGFPCAQNHNTREAAQSSQDEVAGWYSDDDESMEDPDDEFDSADSAAHVARNELGIQVAKQMDAPFDLSGTRMRAFSTLDDCALEVYVPSPTSSPLNDPQTAMVFWHFVNMTGPTISLYERRPYDPSRMFHDQPVPKSMQHIWTYTFPIISFQHPALLQAILALSSLQMAKLQGEPAMASLKHYHFSLRKIAKSYSSPSRRTQPATLAATLLLGFYEVWQSDHDKWCKHMYGARAIIRELPLREMNIAVFNKKQRRRRQQMNERRAQQQQQQQQTYDAFFTPFEYVIGTDMDEVDTALIGRLTGWNVIYDEPAAGHELTERDIENYENLSDLYWWYCKMDVYQSILGGTRLFMEYDLWTQVAPRAPIGRLDAIYGTMDHLMLLLGRLANFASRDLPRKRRVRKAEPGGAGPDQSPPNFPGMIPSRGHVTVPTGFTPPRDSSPRSEEAEDVDLDASTNAALREWEAIRQAFDVWRSQLGPDFEPMGPEFEQPHDSPFGPALTYRTYSIAGIMMNYLMGLIILHRAHPTMPPVAMMAAGMAAGQTAVYANEIGQAAAGLVKEDLSTTTAVSTLVASAFIESSFCLFVAGVQYRDDTQRKWLIKRMHNTARLTGWQSARQIADGCESGWVKAAEMGRGPPYQGNEDDSRFPASVWEGIRRLDRRIREHEGRLVLANSERAHYALGLLSVEQDLDRLDLDSTT